MREGCVRIPCERKLQNVICQNVNLALGVLLLTNTRHLLKVFRLRLELDVLTHRLKCSCLRQRECDYASYTPETLGGPGLEGKGLWTDDRRLSAPALSASLMHVQEVLCAAGRAKEAFPVLAILEHVRFPKAWHTRNVGSIA